MDTERNVMGYIVEGKLYAFHGDADPFAEVLVWDDASDPEPGMPDHIYEFGDPRDYHEVRDRVIAASFAEKITK